MDNTVQCTINCDLSNSYSGNSNDGARKTVPDCREPKGTGKNKARYKNSVNVRLIFLPLLIHWYCNGLLYF